MIATGTPIDRLNGGIRDSSISLIYGPTRCGKTSLMITMVNNFTEKYRSRAIYLDTEQAVSEENFKHPRMVDVVYASSVSEQDKAIKDMVKKIEGDRDVKLVIVDTMTGHFHREVLKTPAQYRASRAADLSGRLVGQISNLRRIMDGRVIFVTAHLRSPVSEYFKSHVLKKMAKAVKESKYTPSIYDYERYMARDYVSWIGGQGLGMHVQFQFRIFVDVDGSRIIRIEKWPMVPNYCIRYVQEGEEFKILGERFIMNNEMKRRLLEYEAEMILAGEAEPLEAVKEEGIEVEADVKTGDRVRAKKKDVKFPKAPSLEELVKREKGEE